MWRLLLMHFRQMVQDNNIVCNAIPLIWGLACVHLVYQPVYLSAPQSVVDGIQSIHLNFSSPNPIRPLCCQNECSSSTRPFAIAQKCAPPLHPSTVPCDSCSLCWHWCSMGRKGDSRGQERRCWFLVAPVCVPDPDLSFPGHHPFSFFGNTSAKWCSCFGSGI